MPPVSRFYGIVIVMNFDEPPGHVPHFHARYAGAWASFSIDPLKLLAGGFPSRAKRMVMEWARMHKDELLETGVARGAGKCPRQSPPLTEEGAMDLHLMEVLAVRHLGGYRLRVGFSDGSVKDVDLSSRLTGPVFEPLKDEGYFSQVRVDPETGTIVWPNGADVAPDTLYLIGVPVAVAA